MLSLLVDRDFYMQKAKTGAKDFFLWAGAMLFLYISIVSFITLLFGYIDYVFPNSLNYYPSNPYESGISYQMAMLIVLAPLFLVLMRVIRRDIEKDETRADLWVRKWALYLTLFVAGITIAADLVTLLYYFLSGQDITVRFLLKVAIVALVGSVVFMHFMADIWGYWVENPAKARTIGVAVGILVILSIVLGFFIIGTPQQARQYRLDEQRTGDLQNIQWQVVYFWQQKERLPASLAELNDPIKNWQVPVDPATGREYVYRATGATTFELCATFALKSNSRNTDNLPRPASAPYGKEVSDNWTHDAGEECFVRTIDPELYPPTNKIAPTN